jgi:preprotein translocase subunit SecY
VLSTIRGLWWSRTLRGKLLATVGILVIFRFFAHVPLNGVDLAKLQALFASNQFLGVMDIFAGGTLARFSVTAVGMSPYITASIILQVAGLVLPKLKEMQRESEATRAQIQQWTRLLTVPVAVVQSLSLLLLLRSQGLLNSPTPLAMASMILSLVIGALIVMWLGELVTKHGVGNGISLMIFAGIISQIPTSLIQTWQLRSLVDVSTFLALAAGMALVLLSVVFMTEAARRIPIQQAKRVRGGSVYGGNLSFLPIKVNQFGVMPIIFALPVLSLPSTLAPIILGLNVPTAVANMVRSIQIVMAPGSVLYEVLYFVFIFAFTFFSIVVYFQPKDFAEDLKKSGTYIPGIRPGAPTAQYLWRLLVRLSFLGGLYLAVVAILPMIAQKSTGITTLSLGGTGLLIVVSVVLEIAQTMQSQLIHDQYEKYA